MGRTFGYKEGDLPVTEDLSARLVRLPMFYQLTSDMQETILDAIRVFAAAERAS